MLNLDSHSKRLITNHLNPLDDLYVICDNNHIPLADNICNIFTHNGFRSFYSVVNSHETTKNAFDESLILNSQTLILVEPKTYSAYKFSKWLDFSHGDPIISNLPAHSFVVILPIASTYRIYGSSMDKDKEVTSELLNTLDNHTKYKLTTDNGTELYFTSRRWINYRDEVLTAPVESSINGTIVVDASLFFQRVANPIKVTIVDGKLHNIYSDHPENHELLAMYKQFTEAAFKNEINKQLAEIGIGVNTGAELSDCFMEAELVYGTCHFCFGNNKCYGGDNISDFHGASVLIKNPKFEIL